MEVSVDGGERVVAEFVIKRSRKDVARMNGIVANFIVFGDVTSVDSGNPRTVSVVGRSMKSVVGKSTPKAADEVISRDSDVLQMDNIGRVEKKANQSKNFSKSVSYATSFSGA